MSLESLLYQSRRAVAALFTTAELLEDDRLFILSTDNGLRTDDPSHRYVLPPR
jgi:hypothetical protein